MELASLVWSVIQYICLLCLIFWIPVVWTLSTNRNLVNFKRRSDKIYMSGNTSVFLLCKFKEAKGLNDYLSIRDYTTLLVRMASFYLTVLLTYQQAHRRIKKINNGIGHTETIAINAVYIMIHVINSNII